MKNWINYQNKTYDSKINNLLMEFLNNYQISDAIDLGCGSGNETVYLVKNGINVTSIDQKLNDSFITDRLTKEEIEKVTFIEDTFENITLPNTQAVMAFFSIPFCAPNKFDLLWNKIYDCIEANGYFVGQLFGNRDDWHSKKNINTFTLEEVKQYLEKYKIIKLEEIEYFKDDKKWHFYNIIVQKRICNTKQMD